MTPLPHAIVAGAAGALFGYITQSWAGAVACLVGGVAIDADHLIDFWLEKKRVPRNYGELKRYCIEETSGRVYLVAHSYEVLAVLWLSYALFRHVLWLGVLTGMTVHMLQDTFFGGGYPLSYFWMYRRRFGFPKEAFFRSEFIKKFKRMNQ